MYFLNVLLSFQVFNGQFNYQKSSINQCWSETRICVNWSIKCLFSEWSCMKNTALGIQRPATSSLCSIQSSRPQFSFLWNEGLDKMGGWWGLQRWSADGREKHLWVRGWNGRGSGTRWLHILQQTECTAGLSTRFLCKSNSAALKKKWKGKRNRFWDLDT